MITKAQIRQIREHCTTVQQMLEDGDPDDALSYRELVEGVLLLAMAVPLLLDEIEALRAGMVGRQAAAHVVKFDGRHGGTA